MKQLQQLAYKGMLLGLGMLAIEANAQKQTKTFNESFKVGEDAVLDINTSYVDIQFETWDKNQVDIEATIELEGASPEEAKKYFENSGIKILGNSQTIEIRTASRDLWENIAFDNSIVVMPDLANIAPLFQDIAIPDLPDMAEMPPMPPIPNIDFDYEAFEKNGEAYLKKWKKEFNKGFDKKYQKRMEEWGEKFKVQAEAQQKRMEKQRKEREENREEMMQQREKMKQQQKEAMEQAAVMSEKAQEMARDIRQKVIISESDNGDAPTIFYRSTDGDSKKYKVKKIIKIKMPKSTRLKMNVRHGEVKLAKNTHNMNATLSHTRLLAATIDGDQTTITASYSPVSVQRWNYGNLNTSFSEEVVLNTVNQITLNTTSSHVIVDKLLKSMLGKNSLGSLHIKAIDTNFSEVDISMKNGELTCVLPKTPFSIYVNNTLSEFSYPDNLNISSKKNNQQLVYTGYYQDKNATKSVKLHSGYSNIVLK